jgi:thiamine-monophosphate kinase
MTQAPSLHPPASPTTVNDLTEAELIARIERRLPPPPPWLLVGIGDDAAVVEPDRNRVEVLTVDALIEGIHFDRAFVPADAIGHRALAVNLSDIAAMGATPRLALLSMALPASFALADFDALVSGFAVLAAEHGVQLAGGNLTRSPGPLMLDVTVAGSVKRRQALTRRGARAEDELYVSGTIGAAAAGLEMLKRSVASATGGTSGSCVDRYLRPQPRVRLGTLVSRNRAAAAAVDLSDGLADAVHQIARASGVGATIDLDALPVDPDARRWFEDQGLDPELEALTGGDDYELLVAVRPRTVRRFAAAIPRSAPAFSRIGTCTAQPSLTMRRQHRGIAAEAPLPSAGFSHFR